MKKYTTKDFDTEFPTDDACLEWIKSHRYPEGIHCQVCNKITKGKYPLIACRRWKGGMV